MVGLLGFEEVHRPIVLIVLNVMAAKLASLSFLLSLLALPLATYGQLNPACPALGPQFPLPLPGTLDPLPAVLAASLKNYTDTVEAALKTGTTSNGWVFDNATTSFSLSLWSVTSNQSLWEYHREGSDIRGNITTGGVLNNDTLYRVGSVSKLYTVYTYLAATGDKHLDEPVTSWVPELAAIDEQWQSNASANLIDNYRWKDVTLRSLASQLSGISRDCELQPILSTLSLYFNQSC